MTSNARMVLLSGLPMELGHVGQGVYAKRLWNLLGSLYGRRAGAIVAKPCATGETQGLQSFSVGRLAGLPLPAPLRQIWLSFLVGLKARREFANDIFFSPGPFIGPLPVCSIVLLHDVLYRKFPMYEGRFLYRKVINRLCERNAARASLILTDSEFSKKEIEQIIPQAANRIRVVLPWVDRSFSEPIPSAQSQRIRQKYGLPGRYWLYIGGYDHRKNVEFLVQSYARAAAIVASPPLVLAGRLPEDFSKPVCRIPVAVRESGVAPELIRTPGFIHDEDLPGLYAMAELLIFPSLMEGFGYPPAEAMSSGCPAIVADNSSLREVVPDLEYRFQTDNHTGLIEMLVRASSGPLPLNPTVPDFTEARAGRDLQALLEPLLYKD